MDLATLYNISKAAKFAKQWGATAKKAVPGRVIFGFRFYKIRQPDPVTHTFAVSFRVFYEWQCDEAEGLEAGTEVSLDLPWPELKVRLPSSHTRLFAHTFALTCV